jgi:phospholipase C
MRDLLFDHIVVLMLENRSFDHLFGHLGVGAGLSNDAVNYLRAGNSSSQTFRTGHGGDFTAAGDGPSHSLKETNVQLFGVTKPSDEQAADPKMSGFVQSFATVLGAKEKRKATTTEIQQVMNVFDPAQLPVLSTLAKSFVLCDHWFADVPGPTMPNRAFVHAATSQGYTWNADWKPQFTCKTLYDRISASNGQRTWRVYSHDQDDVLELYPDLPKDQTNHVSFEGNFLADVTGDELASYSFIVPAFFSASQHPINSMHAPADVRPAEKLVADVYGALKAAPEVWKKTLLIILFDEHGGYYDHVAPPATVSPDDIPGRLDFSYLVPFDFKRLGLRVPSILVSPWFPAQVDSTIYSHSTIPGSVIEAFELPGGFLTSRDAAANRLTDTYLTKKPGLVWRADVPDVVPPPLPQPVDDIQRELLTGSVHLDPHPKARNTWRTRDIQDSAQAKAFVRTQNAKRLEHYFAAKQDPSLMGKDLSADNQPATPTVSPSRIAEMQTSRKK